MTTYNKLKKPASLSPKKEKKKEKKESNNPHATYKINLCGEATSKWDKYNFTKEEEEKYIL